MIPCKYEIGVHLLFGDSLSACVDDVLCFEDLLENTQFNSEYVILNYGVGGYGLIKSGC